MRSSWVVCSDEPDKLAVFLLMHLVLESHNDYFGAPRSMNSWHGFEYALSLSVTTLHPLTALCGVALCEQVLL